MSWAPRVPGKAANVQDLKAQIVDMVSAAVMMVDRDFIVTYVNEPTKELLRKNNDAFRSVWPNFDPAKIIGTCIDTFHKNPAHQRKLLSDPKNLPWHTEITIGDLKISLNVNASFDKRGNYVGNVLEWRDVTAMRSNEGMLAAINKSQAVIEFTLDGKIVTANANFLNTVGYVLDEIRGKHHSMFVEPAYRHSAEYAAFWQKLARGEYEAGQYHRVGKGGKEIWLQASYNPVLDFNNRPFKVVKYATDVTAQAVAVRQVQEVVGAARDNDLSKRIPMQGKSGDVGALCDGVNSLLDVMAAVVSEISKAAREVTNAAAEISASTTDLSQRTEEQAASLEETSAAMEEMAATVKKNADNAQQANEFANSTHAVADRGGAVVGEAVSAMSRIEESSRKISDIIGVIDEIAFQTNLLALNAAVEAARAGEAGRGFAVVASEVRRLAQRSSQAAKDIKELIGRSSGQVQEGVELVNRAGTSLSEIVSSIKQVAQIVSEIAAASAEQATGIDQVNKALTQMDEMTQQNSALVEENAATAKTLEEQSTAMNERVNSFHIGVYDAAQAAPTKAREPVKRVANPARTPAPAAKRPASVRPARSVPRTQGALAVAEKESWEEF